MNMDIEHTFDSKTYRHYMNGFLSVLHCHHYLCLTTSTADKFESLGGPAILRETAEDTIRPLLEKSMKKQSLSGVKESLEFGARFYSMLGLGRMSIKVKAGKGEAQLLRSHIDRGWLSKWGKSDKPVNHFTCGYLNAVFGAVYQRPPRHFSTVEVASIAQGEKTGLFAVEEIK